MFTDAENIDAGAAKIHILLSYEYMAKYIHLQLQNPCNEQWKGMQHNATGAYCSSCNKNVVDFTGMSDNQLIEFFINRKERICGRFDPDQLCRPIEIPSKKTPWLKYFFQISLPALMLSYKANAQRIFNKFKEPVMLTENKNRYSLSVTIKREVSGMVKGENGIPVSFASVIIKGTKEGTAADIYGSFRLVLKNQQDTLEISAVGFETKQIQVADTMDVIELKVALSENINLDGISVKSNAKRYALGGVMHTVRVQNFWKNLQPKFPGTDSTITLFPNPARQNSQLTIRWKRPVSNNQLIIVYNASGQKLMQQTIHISKPADIAQVDLRTFIPGMYTIHAIDVKNNKSHVSTLVIR